MNQNNETWLPVSGYEGRYEVSNKGRVKSLQFKGNKREIILKINITTNGREAVYLCKNGKTKGISVHRLVALAFIKNEYNKPHINHIDNNPLNNHVSNLEWCTPKENTLHAYRQGRLVKFTDSTRKLGQLASRKKVIDSKTEVIYNSVTEAANSNGVKVSTLSAWLRGTNPNPSNLLFYELKNKK